MQNKIWVVVSLWSNAPIAAFTVKADLKLWLERREKSGKHQHVPLLIYRLKDGGEHPHTDDMFTPEEVT